MPLPVQQSEFVSAEISEELTENLTGIWEQGKKKWALELHMCVILIVYFNLERSTMLIDSLLWLEVFLLMATLELILY